MGCRLLVVLGLALGAAALDAFIANLIVQQAAANDTSMLVELARFSLASDAADVARHGYTDAAFWLRLARLRAEDDDDGGCSTFDRLPPPLPRYSYPIGPRPCGLICRLLREP